MSTNILDKVGSVGAVIAGAAVPCCFPFLSLFGSILGLSFFAEYESVIMYLLQGLVLVALIGSFIAYRGHRKILPLILSIFSSTAVLYGMNTGLDIYFIYSGMIGLLIVAVWNTIEARRCEDVCKIK
jgi:hypothetical protein